MNFPTELRESNFKKFEENNPQFALNILRLKTFYTDSKVQRQKITKKKLLNIQPHRLSSYIHDRTPIFLLFLYDPKLKRGHFTTITNYDTLIKQCSLSKSNNTGKNCYKCVFHRYRQQ